MFFSFLVCATESISPGVVSTRCTKDGYLQRPQRQTLQVTSYEIADHKGPCSFLFWSVLPRVFSPGVVSTRCTKDGYLQRPQRQTTLQVTSYEIADHKGPCSFLFF